MSVTSKKNNQPEWVRIVRNYQRPRISKSVGQILTSLVPVWILWIIMYFALQVSFFLMLPFAILSGGFMVRTFIIQHDCGHGSFFKEQKWNDRIGLLCSLMTIVPYEEWRHSHAIHHAHNADLDHRGIGDVFTHTLEEWRNMNWVQKLGYRIYRFPIVTFFIGAPLMFLLFQRAPFEWASAQTRADKISLIRTDLWIIFMMVFAQFTFGLDNLAIIFLSTLIITAPVGVFLFYVQHQFEDVYWSKRPDWSYEDAALKGSTYFRLPKILQWFTGNIGLHHIHHLSPKIPNYELQRCHDENPNFQEVPTITIADSFKIVLSQISIIDEERGKLISFKEARQRIAELEAQESSKQTAQA